MWLINKIFNRSKHKCVFCGDKRKETKKYLVYRLGNENKNPIWVCHTCGRLRGLF
jgi:ribosomal protein S14